MTKTPTEAQMSQPVYSLQTMLRTLADCDPRLPCLVPDGLFGERTLEAVLSFQRDYRFPMTGVVDHQTWQAISALYQQVVHRHRPPHPVQAFQHRDFTVEVGESCLHLPMIQAMFLALSALLEEIEAAPVNGSHTGASVRNILWLQRICKLPETGRVDKATWDRLSRLYALYVGRRPKEMDTMAVLPVGTIGFPWEPFG